MPLKKIIYLIGFMGSGKSTAGKKLAAFMGWSFIDLDRKIEEKAGKTIPRIFETEGEEQFRKIEAETLQELGSEVNIVISTGGGAPCHGNNMDFMLENGLTVYLSLTPDELTKRLLESSGERPLIKNIPDRDLKDFIKKKLVSREPWYKRANITVKGIGLDINKLHHMVESFHP